MGGPYLLCIEGSVLGGSLPYISVFLLASPLDLTSRAKLFFLFLAPPLIYYRVADQKYNVKGARRKKTVTYLYCCDDVVP
jgi:hypothetical protein